MGKTTIEWTDASWNPIVGCTEVSPGCSNCYAARLAATRLKNHPDYKGLAIIREGQSRWNSLCAVRESAVKLRFLFERLEEPLHWKKPRRIFVCDMSDLFHEDIQDEWIDRIYAVMVDCENTHTFQILTKRAVRMQEYFSNLSADRVRKHLRGPGTLSWPLRNIWLGVSVENQYFAEERIPLLLATPATVRWISAEPLLGPVDLSLVTRHSPLPLDWVVCGGESGPNAWPMHPDWARSLRDQCQAAGIPFFFKQWGEYLPPRQDGNLCMNCGDVPLRLGKKAAGRLLDGREWNEFPVGSKQ